MDNIAHKVEESAAKITDELADPPPAEAEPHPAVERLAALSAEQMDAIRAELEARLAAEPAAAPAPADLDAPVELAAPVELGPPIEADVEVVPPPAPVSTAPAEMAETHVEAHEPIEVASAAPASVAVHAPESLTVPAPENMEATAPPTAVPLAASAAAVAAATAVAAAPRVSLAGKVYRAVNAISALLPYALIGLVLRLLMAQVFFLSGQGKIEGLVYRLDLQVFDLSVTVPTGVKESTYLMFDKMANLPLPSWFAAPVVSYAEFILPICLVLGLATRFAAIGLLIMTAVIQLFVVPEALWLLHIYWAAILLVLISRGPGVVSIDHGIRRLYER